MTHWSCRHIDAAVERIASIGRKLKCRLIESRLPFEWVDSCPTSTRWKRKKLYQFRSAIYTAATTERTKRVASNCQIRHLCVMPNVHMLARTLNASNIRNFYAFFFDFYTIPKRIMPSIVDKLLKIINYWWFRYLMVTELYIVEKWERVVIRTYRPRCNVWPSQLEIYQTFSFSDIILFMLFMLVWYFNTSVTVPLVSKFATLPAFFNSANDDQLSAST